MALVLTLQLLMLLLATTSFAAAPPGCPSGPSPNLKPGNTTGLDDFELAGVFLGVGKSNYTCTNSSGYDTAGFNIPLFDATCFNGTDYLDAVVNLTVNDFRENNGNFSELAIYLQEQLTLNISGQLYSLNASALKIDFGDAILRGEDTSILRTIPVSGGDKGKLANDHETVVVLVDAQVLDFNAPPSPGNTSCVVGSPDIGLEAVLRLWIYVSGGGDDCD